MVSRRSVFLAAILATAASAFAAGIFQARRAMPGPRDAASRATLVAEVKQQLASEMGLVPVSLLRDRRSSFVQLYSYDDGGRTHYGTAGYLGHGYFITVKHAVVGLDGAARIASVAIVYRGAEIPAHVVDTGDASVAVHRGDWAIIKSRE